MHRLPNNYKQVHVIITIYFGVGCFCTTWHFAGGFVSWLLTAVNMNLMEKLCPYINKCASFVTNLCGELNAQWRHAHPCLDARRRCWTCRFKGSSFMALRADIYAYGVGVPLSLSLKVASYFEKAEQLPNNTFLNFIWKSAVLKPHAHKTDYCCLYNNRRAVGSCLFNTRSPDSSFTWFILTSSGCSCWPEGTYCICLLQVPGNCCQLLSSCLDQW